MEPSESGSRVVSLLNTRFLSLLEGLPRLGGEPVPVMIPFVSLPRLYLLSPLVSKTEKTRLGPVSV